MIFKMKNFQALATSGVKRTHGKAYKSLEFAPLKLIDSYVLIFEITKKITSLHPNKHYEVSAASLSRHQQGNNINYITSYSLSC